MREITCFNYWFSDITNVCCTHFAKVLMSTVCSTVPEHSECSVDATDGSAVRMNIWKRLTGTDSRVTVWKLLESRPCPVMTYTSKLCFEFFSFMIATFTLFIDSERICTWVPPVSLNKCSFLTITPLMIQPGFITVRIISVVWELEFWKNSTLISFELGGVVEEGPCSEALSRLASCYCFFLSYTSLFWSSIFLLLSSNCFSEALLFSASTVWSISFALFERV